MAYRVQRQSATLEKSYGHKVNLTDGASKAGNKTTVPPIIVELRLKNDRYEQVENAIS